MSNRDRVAKNQAGNSGEIPKLPIDVRLKMKLNPATNQPAFTMWEKGENGAPGKELFGEKPLKGLLIGNAMMMRAYSESIGRNGGSLTSAPYLSKDNIVLFEPTAAGFKKVIQGNKELVEATILSKFPQAKRPSVMVIYYLYVFPTKNKPAQLIQVDTNGVLAFEDMKKHKQGLAQNYCILTPTLYSANDATISVNAHKLLGKLAKTNPPRYARISIGEPIPDELYESDDLGELLDAWDTWKAFQLSGKEVKVKEEQASDDGDNNHPPVTNNAGFKPGRDPEPWNAPQPGFTLDEEETNDLPF